MRHRLVARTWQGAALRSLLQMLVALTLYTSLEADDAAGNILSVLAVVAFAVVSVVNGVQSGFLRGIPSLIAALAIVAAVYCPVASAPQDDSVYWFAVMALWLSIPFAIVALLTDLARTWVRFVLRNQRRQRALAHD